MDRLTLAQDVLVPGIYLIPTDKLLVDHDRLSGKIACVQRKLDDGVSMILLGSEHGTRRDLVSVLVKKRLLCIPVIELAFQGVLISRPHVIKSDRIHDQCCFLCLSYMCVCRRVDRGCLYLSYINSLVGIVQICVLAN